MPNPKPTRSMTDDELRDWAQQEAAAFHARHLDQDPPVPAEIYFPTAAELAAKRARTARDVDDVAAQERGAP